MRKNLQGDSANLKALFGLVDSMQVTDPKLKDTLKNEIFQLHLLTLPEASFRKQFIKRKGTAGFSGDALRNFITSGTRFANQIARIKYGPEIRNSLSAAEASLEGDPDRPKKSMVTNELGLRVKDELEPDFRDTAIEKIARTVNKAAFIWLLTSVHSAANQLFSVVNFTLPTLAKYHGWGPATAQLMQTVATMYTQVGTTSLDKDGNVTYTAPTMMNNRSLRLSPIEQRAYQAMLDRGIADATRTQDLFLRKGQPSATYNDKTAKIVNALGALFHTTESLSREVTFMAAFRLNIRKMPFEAVMRMALLGRHERMSAQRAFELGMISEVVDPPDRLREAAQELAEKIARNSPAAMAASKRALWRALEMGLTDACRAGSHDLVSMWGHPDQEEGPRAFAEKRDANWAVPD